MKRMRFCQSIVLLLFLCIATSASTKVYLVSVGIADYPGTGSDLTLPTQDANTIAWLYGKNAGAEYVLLTNHRATKKNITNAIRSLFAKAKENDIVVFFFSGHGSKNGLETYNGTLSYAAIRQTMAQCKARNKMMFVDACYAGKLRTSGLDHNAELAARKANIMLFLSSRGNETSRESSVMQNGYFTTYLQQGLRGRADYNQDRVITAKEIFSYVYTNVTKISANRQHPVMWGNFSNSMPVMTWR